MAWGGAGASRGAEARWRGHPPGHAPTTPPPPQSFALLAALALAALTPHATALSVPACDVSRMTWVSESPHLSGAFPRYQQLFHCRGNVNLEGLSVDAASPERAAAAFCALLGFDGAVPSTTEAEPSPEPTLAADGSWCTGIGVYDSAAGPDAGRDARDAARDAYTAATAADPATRCDRLAAVTCYRGRASLAASWKKAGAALAPAPAPAAEPASLPRVAIASTDGGRRRLMMTTA